MEGSLLARECKLKRCYDCNRLEEEIWKQAYEQLWPLVRRQLQHARDGQARRANDPPRILAKGA